MTGDATEHPKSGDVRTSSVTTEMQRSNDGNKWAAGSVRWGELQWCGENSTLGKKPKINLFLLSLATS